MHCPEEHRSQGNILNLYSMRSRGGGFRVESILSLGVNLAKGELTSDIVEVFGAEKVGRGHSSVRKVCFHVVKEIVREEYVTESEGKVENLAHTLVYNTRRVQAVPATKPTLYLIAVSFERPSVRASRAHRHDLQVNGGTRSHLFFVSVVLVQKNLACRFRISGSFLSRTPFLSSLKCRSPDCGRSCP